MTEFEKGYEQGYKDGMAGAALPNVNDNGDKIDGYSYAYKTDSNGEPYIHIDSVRSMLKKAADVQPVNQWISVEDRLPDENQKCLVYRDINADLKITTGIWHSEWKAFDGLRHGTRLEDTIAWMPLLEPPKDGDT